MDPNTVDVTIKAYLKEMRERLEQASSIAMAADTCADAGNLDKAIQIALDVEELIYEVNSLSPSVWRQGGCESHFIVWRGRIIWCGRFEDDNREPAYDAAFEAQVLAAMDISRFRSSYALTDQLNEIPWDVSRCARSLVARGLAESGTGAHRDSFRRVARQAAAQAAPRPGLWTRLWQLLFGGKQ